MTTTNVTCLAGSLVTCLLVPVLLPAQETVALPAADRSLALRFEPLWTVGELGGEPWEEFQSLDGAAFGDDGRLYLLDGEGGRVVAVDGEGRFLHRVGSPGDGPGEYRSPSGLVARPDGGVAVWGFRKRAFLLYGPDGAHVDEVRPDLEAGLPEAPLAPGPDGRVLALPARILTGRLGHAYLTASSIRRADGSLPFLSIPMMDGGRVRIVTEVRIPVPEGAPPHPVRRAFEPLPSWGPLAGGRIALSHSADYRIEVVGPDGRLERVLERPPGARPTTEADREAYRREQRKRPARRLGGGGGGGAPPGPSDLWFSPVVPPVLAITTDGDDRIWVLRRSPEDPTRPGPVDVLTADGRYLGTIPGDDLEALGDDGLPDAFGPDGRVAFLGRGALDVPVVRVYRLPEALR